MPPRKRCSDCAAAMDKFVAIKPVGELVNYTVAYRNINGRRREEPVFIGLIKLDGADAWMLAPIKNTAPEQMRSGLPIRVVWNEERSGKLKDIQHFEAVR